MKKRLRNLMKNQKTRIAFGTLGIGMLVILSILFIAMELRTHQALYLKRYEEEQQLLTDQVALRMKYYIESEALDLTKVSDKLSKEVITTGSRFWFFAVNEELLFVKNEGSTRLYADIPLAEFLENSRKEGILVSESSFQTGSKQYTIGICTRESYITDAGQLFKHGIYILMPVILISAAAIMALNIYMLKIHRQESRIKTLTGEAIDRNNMIEQLSNDLKKIKLDYIEARINRYEEVGNRTIYSNEVLAQLLNKINQGNIAPLTIFVLELRSKNRSITVKDYEDMVKEASQYIDNEHVMAEIIPGMYSILIFHSALEQDEEIKKNLMKQWAQPMKKQGIKLRMGISRIEGFDVNVENIFERVYSEVASTAQSDVALP